MAEPVPTSGARRAERGRTIARAAGLVLVGAAALPAVAAPRGRVVRVERSAAHVVPRLCALGEPRGQKLCFGAPQVGERVAVIDLADRSVRGELVIEAVGEATELSAIGLCMSSGIKSVRGTYTSDIADAGQVVGLRGIRLDRRVTRVLADTVPPSGNDGETVSLALDTDGNGRADLVLTQYSCDPSGALSSSAEASCFDTYMERRGRLERVQQDILRACR